ncbi:MAG: response regulator [Fibrobacter sp.]|nr:response regulator [Fibrobacter sp.]
MKRILLADDEESLLLAYKKLLYSPGIQIDTTQTVSEAAGLLKENFYDAIIVDLRLEGSAEMDGIEIICHARALYPEIKIIVLTAYSDTPIKDTVLNAGASYFLEKPTSAFQIKTLLSVMGVYS